MPIIQAPRRWKVEDQKFEANIILDWSESQPSYMRSYLNKGEEEIKKKNMSGRHILELRM